MVQRNSQGSTVATVSTGIAALCFLCGGTILYMLGSVKTTMMLMSITRAFGLEDSVGAAGLTAIATVIAIAGVVLCGMAWRIERRRLSRG